MSDGRLDLLCNHVTIDEAAEAQDVDLRQRKLLAGTALCRLVPTGATVFDFSRFDFACLGSDDEAFEAFRAGNLKHTRDALICATAQLRGCAVITNDMDMAKRGRRRGVEVLRCDEVDARLPEEKPESLRPARP